MFPKQIRPNFYYVVRPKTKKVPIKGGVVKGAKCDPVGDDGFTFRISIRNNVGCIQELLMAQLTESALAVICFQDSLTEGPLV